MKTFVGLTKADETSLLQREHQKVAYRVLKWVAIHGPCTFLECQSDLGVPVAQRMHDLERAGCLKRTGERRRTRGRSTGALYAYVPGSSFIAYLGMPPAQQSKKDGLSDRQRAILEAGESYVKAVSHHLPMKQFRRALRILMKRLYAHVPAESGTSKVADSSSRRSEGCKDLHP